MRNSRRIKENLIDNEVAHHFCKMHWGVFFWPVTYMVLGLLVGLGFSWIVGGAMMFMAAFPLGNAMIIYTTTEFAVTNKRVLAFYGFFTTDLLQINLERLEGAAVERGIMAQILGYSTVSARGTGAGTIAIPFLADGKQFKKMLDNIIYKDK